MSEHCESCKFFRPLPKGDSGKCRRYPPTICTNANATLSPKWYCGEHKETEQQEK